MMNNSVFSEINEHYKNATKKSLFDSDHSAFPKQINKFIQNGGAHRFNSISASAKAELLKIADPVSLDILISTFTRGGLVNALKLLNEDAQENLIQKKISIENHKILEEVISGSAPIYNKNLGWGIKNKIPLFYKGRENSSKYLFESINKKYSELKKDSTTDEDKFFKTFENYKNIQDNKNKENSDLIESLLQKLKNLESANSKVIQDRIDEKLTKYVESSEDTLNAIQKSLKGSAALWSFIAGVVVVVTLCVGVAYSLFGYKFGPPLSTLKWPELLIVSIKGMVVISSLGVAGIYAFVKSNSYMHEAIIVSNRAHAIQFGKLYLQIYGNTVEGSDMVKVFENWNISSDTAFSKKNNKESESLKISEFFDIAKKIKELLPAISKN